MKNFTLLGLAFLMLSSTTYLFGQKTTNKTALLELAANASSEFQQKKAAALIYAAQNNIPVIIEDDSTYMELMDIDEHGIPQYYITNNAISSASISTNKVNTGGGYGYSLDGNGMTVYLWDAAGVLTSHQEFGGRVTQIDNPGGTNYHSTHVAGTIMASGVVGAAKGMAPAANLNAYDWNSDASELATAGANGALVSSHSYGYANGWEGGIWYGNPDISDQEDFKFGRYGSRARNWDQIAYDAPYLLICKSAGNDRNDTGPGPYPPDGPYDCIEARAIAKNLLTVGAVYDIPGGYTQPSDVVMTTFSSWGPADDGRIKPDISANGTGLYSSINNSDTSYASLSGTSMSTPSVAGSLILLQELHEELKGSNNFMLAATLKALLIHTADEAGAADGPDYEFGWGLMNTYTAAALISDDDSLNTLEERLLTDGGTYERTVTAAGGQPLKVTIVWTDPPADIAPLALDPPDPAIVNELDLRITESTNTYYPWKLDKDNPSLAATRNSENNVDNVEMVTIDNPTAGTQYTIVVDHDGALAGGSQAFSLVVSGIAAPDPQAPIAAFISTDTSLVEGQTAAFYDESTNIPTSWSWSFPGGTPSTSTLQNPTVTYDTPGRYDVSLTVTNSTNTPNTMVKTGYVDVVCASRSLSFSHVYISDVTIGDLTNSSDGSEYSDFTSLTMNATQSMSYPITLSFWKDHPSHKADWRVWMDFNLDGDFEDAGELVFSADNKSNTVNGTVTVPSNTSVGMTRMRVSMRDGTGGFGPCDTPPDGEVEDYSVNLQPDIPLPPVADFEGTPTTVTVGNSVDFTDLSLNDPTSWDWSFTGGTPASSTQQNPTVTYSTEGVYTVSLTATNSEGSDTKTKIDYITVVAGGCPDADGDGVCDADDICPGYDDNIDTDGDGIPDGCDPCTSVSDVFPDDPLTHSGPGSSPTSYDFGASGHTDVSFVVTGLDAKTNGNPNNRYIDLVTVTYTDAGGTWTYGTFSGENTGSANVDIAGPVYSVTVTLQDGYDGNPPGELSVDPGPISSCPPEGILIENGDFDGNRVVPEFSVYPNPAGDRVTFRLHGIADAAYLTIYDNLGSSLWTKQVEAGQYTLQLDLDNDAFQNGLYFVSLVSHGERITKHMVVMK